jgi:8-oxo-dGTP pyrophosphatase MutT (NUDIX family)
MSPKPAPVRARHAASLIIVDRAGAEPKMLMGRRNPAHRFMPDVFVFPGGRVERSDHRLRLDAPLHPRLRRLLMMATPVRPPLLPEALVAAALREAAEETGLHFLDPDDVMARFSPDGLRFVARALTPSFLPRRFDTRFFMIEAERIIKQTSGAAGPDQELTELVWVTAEEAQSLPIHAITRNILKGLPTFLMDEDDLTPVPFYRVRGERFVITPLST